MERHAIAARRRVLDRSRKIRVRIRSYVLSPNAVRLVQGKRHRSILELGRGHMFSAITILRFWGILHVRILDFYSPCTSAIQFILLRIVSILYRQYDISINVSHQVRIERMVIIIRKISM